MQVLNDIVNALAQLPNRFLDGVSALVDAAHSLPSMPHVVSMGGALLVIGGVTLGVRALCGNR
jgi:hypothetical protein